ncbi:hypothetical protein Ciccas_005386 [Cichlidogyrus casuarinus]|uniref:Uncharacterized protein n=1 Tax=Cichlidogyrus casuarinus TaxID=1844966 RepID=A0ABD2Q917_9PLAT
MILAMKSVSFVEEYIKKEDGLHFGRAFPNSLVYLSYCLWPATLLFGPWISLKQYLGFFCLCRNGNCFSRALTSFGRFCIVMMQAISFLLYSTCISSYLFDHFEDQSTKLSYWIDAYAKSQSFRFGHYFVNFFSESLLHLNGYADDTKINESKCSCNYHICIDLNKESDVKNLPYAANESQLNFCSSKDLRIVHPLTIEFPRSLVQVVVHWNISMHIWLKNCTFERNFYSQL